MTCIFCNPDKDRIIKKDRSGMFYFVHDKYPVSKGHLLVIPYEHYEEYFGLPYILKDYIWKAVDTGKKYLDEVYKPDGFNVGFNQGESAGQSIFHLHIHIIPRYDGDYSGEFTGGIRNVMNTGNYQGT